MKLRILMGFSFLCSTLQAQDNSVSFYYLGQSSFLIIFEDKLSILTDYGKPNAYLQWGWDSPVNDLGNFRPTICTYSHAHDDHLDSTRISSDKCIILKTADTLQLGELTIYPILTSEKTTSVKDNLSYLIEYKQLRILHLGDCQANIMNIDSVENELFIRNTIPAECDVVLFPIESTEKFIPQAAKFIRLINPKTLIPMHYWSDEYKQEFLDYLERGNSVMQNSCCQVIHKDNSAFTYSKSAGCPDTIRIISLRASEFQEK